MFNSRYDNRLLHHCGNLTFKICLQPLILYLSTEAKLSKAKNIAYLQVISCNKNICTLQITDTTGSHQFPAMQRLSISKGHAFILVYSVTSRQSLEELRPIWDIIREMKGADLATIPVMLVGNKCDETENREVSCSSR